MERVTKKEAVHLIARLKDDGWTNEELAVELGKTGQTIWAWGSEAEIVAGRIPDKSDYEALYRLLKKGA